MRSRERERDSLSDTFKHRDIVVSKVGGLYLYDFPPSQVIKNLLWSVPTLPKPNDMWIIVMVWDM